MRFLLQKFKYVCIMTLMPTLKATERDLAIKLDTLRKEGNVPAVFYGKKHDATPISISSADFKKVWKEVGETSTVLLATSGGTVNVMVYDVQVNPVKDEFLHVDFYVVEKGQKVEVEVEKVGKRLDPISVEIME